MSDLTLRLYPDPILKQEAFDISAKNAGAFKDISEAMFTVLRATDTGVGLAANQVGLTDKIIIVSYDGDLTLLNPKVIKKSEDTSTDYEGCLSFPSVGGFVVRPSSITVEFMTLEGETRVEDFDGTVARIVQHEIDHINGINLIDVMSKNELRKNKAALKVLVKAAKAVKGKKI